ncbi:hypothetical protein ACFW1A_09355 [Kitasatospora sp. NPDC058965]|uniref:hypothetical protein n=1 Tax=Kitasatospora sp. NPDC058965 TaxID=3346682 RepID=UPI0036898F96
MSFTVPPPPLDPAKHFPDLVPHARSTTLLYPRAGTPGRWESSLGGPPLWPTAEPWPMCAAADHYNPARGRAAVGPDPVAMVPVVQLFAKDVPALEFPAGADVLQVLWCPLIHSEHDHWSPVPTLRWRSAAEAASGQLRADVPQPYECDDEYLPRPCVVHPTEADEYPNWDLPDDLAERVGEWSEEIEESTGLSYFDAFTTRQSKVGGYPGWSREPRWPECVCGERMEHLLTVSASESCGRWLPMEERTPPDSGREVSEAPQENSHGMVMGDGGGIYVFVCRDWPDWPTIHR